jgi:alanine racemase
VSIARGAAGGAERLRGEPAMLIGDDADQRITAEEVARRLDTINYEVTCGLTARVARVHHRDGVLAEPVAATAGSSGAGSWLPPRHA